MIQAAMLLIFLLMLLIKRPLLQPLSDPAQSTTVALGFILIFAFLFGKKAASLKLPQITGYILAGVLCGPYVLKFLSASDVADLQLLDGLALSLIALTAGGEMHLDRLRGRLRSISSVVVFQTLTIIAGFIVFGMLVLPLFGTIPQSSFPQLLAFSLLLGTLATATSPSTTIAVITETQSEGRNTDLVLSTAVVKDFVVIGFFAFALSVAHALVMPGEGLGVGLLWHLFKEVGGSILLGGVIGMVIILYLRHVKKELAVFILGIAFFTYEISHAYGFHPLMICLLAGFIVQNFSSQGDSLITALEKVSTPVYVVFFAISGASLDLTALQQGWLLAVLCIVWRGVLKFGGTYAGSRISGEPRLFQRLGWSGFISQAGVALGMAIEVEEALPVWGKTFKTLILAVIALNQVIGPVLLQKFLIRSGEAERKEPARVWSRRAPEPEA